MLKKSQNTNNWQFFLAKYSWAWHFLWSTTVGIFIFISRQNFMLSWVEHEKNITSGPGASFSLKPPLFWAVQSNILCILESMLSRGAQNSSDLASEAFCDCGTPWTYLTFFLKKFSCSTQLSMKFVLLIELKSQPILLDTAEHETFSANKYENANNSANKYENANNCWHFHIY